MFENLFIVDPTKREKESSFFLELQRLQLYQYAIFIVVVSLWFTITPSVNIWIAFYFAAAFFVIETIFCTATEAHFESIVFSTPEQFILNVLCVSMIAPYFNHFFIFLPRWIRALVAAPLFIWTLEIVEGHLLIMTFGYNRAWQYQGDDVLFNGTIKISYAPLWIGMSLGFFYFVGDWIDSMEMIAFTKR